MHGQNNIKMKYECQLRMFSVQCLQHCRSLTYFNSSRKHQLSHVECTRRNLPYCWGTFLRLNYVDLTKHNLMPSGTVRDTMTRYSCYVSIHYHLQSDPYITTLIYATPRIYRQIFCCTS